CRQCFLRQHRRSPTHWAAVWSPTEKFFRKTDISRIRTNSAIYLGHDGDFCEHSAPRQHFTLADTNGVHPTVIAFCGCPDAPAHWKQLLTAGIFPATIQSPQTGFTFRVLEQWREYRHQGHLSIWDFTHILQRLADPWIPTSVPDISRYFDNITRIFHLLNTRLARGHAHGVDSRLLDECDRAYPHRPSGYLGTVCAACPEPGVNMPTFVVCYFVGAHRVASHLSAEYITLDGNFKANLFYKRDNGTDKAVTDGQMYFPPQQEFEEFAKAYVVNPVDKVPCQAHIGSIRNQSKFKYKNTRVSGVVAFACAHGVAGGLVDMLISEAPAPVASNTELRQLLLHADVDAHQADVDAPADALTCLYTTLCSWVVNQVPRVIELFPEDEWLHQIVAAMEGQVPGSHIVGHGRPCKIKYQPAYFPCRAHFHGESAETIWPYLNGFGPSLRQMNAGARHDNINFAMDNWNFNKVLRMADQIGGEREEALKVLAANLTVFKQLTEKHANEVVAWSKESRDWEMKNGVLYSVYQHNLKTVATIDDVLDSLRNSEVEANVSNESVERPPTAEWIRWGIDLRRSQLKIEAYLAAHTEHPLQDTWKTICDLRDKLGDELENFRSRQSMILPALDLSPHDVDLPEKTLIQIPSQLLRQCSSSVQASMTVQEIELRCGQANTQIIAVQEATISLSIIRGSRAYDYRGQGGKTRAQRSQEFAEMLRNLEITVYGDARDALIVLGYMLPNAKTPFPPMTIADTVRKETHLFRARGDSRVVNGSIWQPAGSIVSACYNGPHKNSAPLRRSPAKRQKKNLPAKPSKPRKERTEGWIWKEDALLLPKEANANVAAFKKESDRVQWFRAESELFRWLEQYELKHAELWRVIERFRREAYVWEKRAQQIEESASHRTGAIMYARMQGAMWRRLRDAAETEFKSDGTGAHRNWIQAKDFADLVHR
ncbi:hypothetical protein GGX14DRAFT_313533, partial [Mycena pura]